MRIKVKVTRTMVVEKKPGIVSYIAVSRKLAIRRDAARFCTYTYFLLTNKGLAGI